MNTQRLPVWGEDSDLEKPERMKVRVQIFGWRFNRAGAHSPEWTYPAALPQGYTLGGPLTLINTGDKYTARELFVGMRELAGYNEKKCEALVLVDNTMKILGGDGSLRDLVFNTESVVDADGNASPVVTKDFAATLSEIVDLQRKKADLYLQLYAACAHKLGDW